MTILYLVLYTTFVTNFGVESASNDVVPKWEIQFLFLESIQSFSNLCVICCQLISFSSVIKRTWQPRFVRLIALLVSVAWSFHFVC